MNVANEIASAGTGGRKLDKPGEGELSEEVGEVGGRLGAGVGESEQGGCLVEAVGVRGFQPAFAESRFQRQAEKWKNAAALVVDDKKGRGG